MSVTPGHVMSFLQRRRKYKRQFPKEGLWQEPARRACAGTYDALANLVTSSLFETRPWMVESS